jgi:hypothetical protein
MTIHKKAADRGDGQAAAKTSRTCDHSNCKRPASTFIQVDAHPAIGADSYSWDILQGRQYKGGCKWEPTTVATLEGESSRTVAKVATVAVAKAENSKTNEPTPHTIPHPAEPCAHCGYGQWWQIPGQPWHCCACQPDMPLTAPP